MARKFLRRIWKRYSKLGRGRKKKQVWRKPKGRDNKMREKRRGYPAVVGIGHRNDRSVRGMIRGKKNILVHTTSDLLKAKSLSAAVIIAKVGEKKRKELISLANENGVEIINNPNKKGKNKKHGSS